jgi:hypothetical protein
MNNWQANWWLWISELRKCCQLRWLKFRPEVHWLWSWLRSLLSVSVGWRCTFTIASPAGQRIVCCGMLARKASGSLVLTKHSEVSFHWSLHVVIHREINTLLLLLSTSGMRFLDQEMCFHYCCAQKPWLAIIAIFMARLMLHLSNWS